MNRPSIFVCYSSVAHQVSSLFAFLRENSNAATGGKELRAKTSNGEKSVKGGGGDE